jgi:hypothetical protein
LLKASESVYEIKYMPRDRSLLVSKDTKCPCQLARSDPGDGRPTKDRGRDERKRKVLATMVPSLQVDLEPDAPILFRSGRYHGKQVTEHDIDIRCEGTTSIIETRWYRLHDE